MIADSRFDKALKFTLEHEGGFVDHPNDPGGATNLGISIRALKSLEEDWLDDWDLDSDGDVDAADMKLITEPQAKGFYRRHFWKGYMDQVLSPKVGIKLFDMGVNMGTRQAGRLLQRSLNHNGEKLVEDGVVGRKTVGAVNKMVRSGANNRLLDDLCSTQSRFYFKLVDTRSSREPFLLGWLRRAYALPH